MSCPSNSFRSWKDIHGFRLSHKVFTKSDFYDGGSFANQAHSIATSRDPTEPGKMRKYLSPAFSDRSLMEQEDLIAGVIDIFISQIGKSGVSGVDLSMGYGRVTFNFICSLAFGGRFWGGGVGIW